MVLASKNTETEVSTQPKELPTEPTDKENSGPKNVPKLPVSAKKNQKSIKDYFKTPSAPSTKKAAVAEQTPSAVKHDKESPSTAKGPEMEAVVTEPKVETPAQTTPETPRAQEVEVEATAKENTPMVEQEPTAQPMPKKRMAADDENDADVEEELPKKRKLQKSSSGASKKNLMFIKTSVSGGMAVRKVGINEKKLSLDYDPVSLMELSDFYKYLSELTEPIDVIPEQFGSLICRLVQDTDYELKVIAKKVLNLLVISSSHVPYLPQQVIENAIEKYLERVNYGISDDHKNLALYRWEVKNYETLHSAKSSINEDAINQLISKIAERRSLREDGMVHLQELVENMSEEERVALLSCEATPKATKTKEEREAEKERLKREKELEKQRLKEEKEQERQRLKQEKEAEKLRLKNEKEAEKQKFKDEKRKSLASAKKETPKTVLDSKKKRQSQCTLKDFFLQSSTTKPRNQSSPIRIDLPPQAPVEENEFEKTFPDFEIKKDFYMAKFIFKKRPIVMKEDYDGDIEIVWPPSRKAISSLYVLGKEHGTVTEEAKTMLKENKSRVKFLQFCDNYRPAFFGTWNRKSLTITGRRPLITDSNVFDYEVDSDEEWESDAEGDECLSDDPDEDAEEEEEASEEAAEDDGWLVPNGYLSEGEGIDEDEEPAPKPCDPKSTETEDSSKKQKTKKRFEGYFAEATGPSFGIGPVVIHFTHTFKAPFDPLETLNFLEDATTKTTQDSQHHKKQKKSTFPEEFLNDLVSVLKDSNGAGIDKCIEKFRDLSDARSLVPKTVVERKIREIATKEKHATMKGKFEWILKNEAGEAFHTELKSEIRSVADNDQMNAE